MSRSLGPQQDATGHGRRSVAHYPVNLVVDGRRCLVVGGGPVAARKAGALVHCGALVTLVAPTVCDEAAALGLHAVERRAYRRGEAARYRLVITATGDPAVDQAVFEDAEAAGVWVNAADDPQRCSFTLPAVHRQGSVLVTASTGGASPALASWLRSWLEGAIGPEFAALAAELAEERARLHAAGASTQAVDWRPRIESTLAGLREAT